MSQLSHIKNTEKGKLRFFSNVYTTFELQKYVIKNNMDLVRDTAAKIVRIHELEAENKRLRDSVKSISINNQDTEIHVCEEAHLSTSTPKENSDVRKPKGTLLIGSSIIRDINK
jgi:hypothetical protein